ncbi:hypothetical protein H2198_004527 [Neophaeococcomyces mojaviensis]|uniref:Uncharacterized protein n=1 Tax=Neophaeococcomyces mojaviensis TaxID=3383035 RepID=A0ACC3A8E3_9EURO|nr:hypothetical protein H2198_004527 [Knufia sp. JES_112]
MTITVARRKATQLNVPTLDDDPAERKRVLNVLAQRRYRRRKKEQIRSLENQARKNPEQLSSTETSSADCDTPTPSENSSLAFPTYALEVDPAFNSVAFLSCSGDSYAEFLESSCSIPTAFDAPDMTFLFPLPSMPPSPSPTPPSNSLAQQDGQSSQEQSIFEETLDFPDEAHLPMLELNLLRAAMSIAQRLKVDSLIWSLDASSPFYRSSSELYLNLPPNLRPTPAQLLRPHHPVLDILPWPTVRDKLIMVFSQPVNIRPPSAKSPTALIELVFDLEDPSEGVRVWGDDPCAGDNWEVGQKLFSNWWWALDSQVLSRSNEMRKERGAPLLRDNRDRDIQEIE